jgi:hypothetical protein
MAEDVERVTIRREAGSSDSSGAYTVIGIILGVLIVAGAAVAIIGVPEIQAWWADPAPAASSTSTTVVTPDSTTTTNSGN